MNLQYEDKCVKNTIPTKIIQSSMMIFFFIFWQCSMVTTVFSSQTKKQVIILVWDGLRPDAVTKENTPHLFALMKSGVEFKDHHASFPTVTVINAASLVTGNHAGETGFFGNELWHPNAKNHYSDKKVDFHQPVFTDDNYILRDLSLSGLTLRDTLFQIAKQQGIKTAFIGNVGARFLADSQLPDINRLMPKQSKLYYLQDGVTPDPTDKHSSSYTAIDDYFAKTYLLNILPKQKPQLSVIWLADPDGTEHDFGFGTPRYTSALKKNDKILGELEYALRKLGMEENTDVLVVSDHAQSFISGPLAQFPLRTIKNHQVGALDKNGYSTSGDIRAADLMTKAGFHAYDGEGCRYDPVLSGIMVNGKSLYLTHTDITGSICGQVGQKYNTPSYKVPDLIHSDAIIIAANSSSEYFYLPSHNLSLIKKLVRFLQNNEVFGAIFINTQHYPLLPGTLSLESIHLGHPTQAPDLVVGLAYDANEKINHLSGIEFCDYPNERGTHGSFSPIDVHAFFAAKGPDFRNHFQDFLPTGSADIAPTVASLLGISLTQREGRVINEARHEQDDQDHSLQKIILTSTLADHLNIVDALNNATNKSRYQINLYIKKLKQGKETYTYFDEAHAIRE